METLSGLIGKIVCVLTLEGRSLVGTLKGVDNVGNLVLEEAHERTFHLDKGMQMEPMGLYLIRGDSLFVVLSFVSYIFSLKMLPYPSPLTLIFSSSLTVTFCSGVMGEVDPELDAAVNWDAVRGEPLDGIVLSGGQQ